jgi:hypothetical protein
MSAPKQIYSLATIARNGGSLANGGNLANLQRGRFAK